MTMEIGSIAQFISAGAASISAVFASLSYFKSRKAAHSAALAIDEIKELKVQIITGNLLIGGSGGSGGVGGGGGGGGGFGGSGGDGGSVTVNQ